MGKQISYMTLIGVHEMHGWIMQLLRNYYVCVMIMEYEERNDGPAI